MADPKVQKKKKKSVLVFIPDWPLGVKNALTKKVHSLRKEGFIVTCKNPALYSTKDDFFKDETLELIVAPDPETIKEIKTVVKDFKGIKTEFVKAKPKGIDNGRSK